MNKNLQVMLTAVKFLSGSTMDIEDIYNQYLDLTSAKRFYLHKESKSNIKDLDRLLKIYKDDDTHAFNNSFESRLGLLSVNMNLIALDNDIGDVKLDPATVLLCGIDKKNSKVR